MHIEEVIIDGFKSYANRTVISGWDPTFNAITGLNGSGKSNILDAICFVLGISNLSHVRAANLQDLVYKRGQAGITKATVTIVFSNPDPKNSPIGYEHCRQITVTRQVIIGGKNKYMVNGHIAQQRTIANLFQSVQLNVNNPHFLIMQGKITKVLNMKPPEVLAMIEEAAGTRMYEDKKENAEKIIEKKEKKLEEIQRVLNEMIIPDLEKKRRERTAFLEYQKTEIEIERLRQFVVAHDYYTLSYQLEMSLEGIAKQSMLVEKTAAEVNSLKYETAVHELKMKELAGSREKETGSRLNRVEKEVESAAEQLTRITAQLLHKSQSTKEELITLEKLKLKHIDLTKQIMLRAEDFATAESAYHVEKHLIDEQSLTLKRNEQLVQALQTGMSGQENDGTAMENVSSDGSFMGRIHEAKQSLANARTEMKQLAMTLQHRKIELTEKHRQLKANEGENTLLNTQYQQAIQVIAELDLALGKGCPMKKLLEQEKTANQEKELFLKSMADLQSKYDELTSSLSHIDFKYTEPHGGFDHRQVFGLVAKLIHLKPEQIHASAAIEITAGGQLYQVIVQDEKIASQLLEKGQLQRRVTIIPLSKIAKKPEERHQLQQKVQRAMQLAPGKVEAALSLIGYNEDVAAAIEYIFGSTLICQDKETAKLMAFDPQVKLRSVTLEGDLYNPTGTLTGGSKATASSILLKLGELSEVQSTLDGVKEKLLVVEGELIKMKRQLKDSAALAQRMKLKQHEMELLKDQIARTSQSQVMASIEELELNLIGMETKLRELTDVEKSLVLSVNKYTEQMADFNKDRTSKLKSLELTVEQEKKAVAIAFKAFNDREDKFRAVQADFEQLRDELKIMEDQMILSSGRLEILEKEKIELSQQMEQAKALYTCKKLEYQNEAEARMAFDKELKTLDSYVKNVKGKLSRCEISLKTLEHEQCALQQDQAAQNTALHYLEKEYPWIQDQRHTFGHDNTPFDFKVQKPVETKRHLEQLETRQNDLRKNVNSKVMTVIDRLEKEETLLKEKVAIVQNDKGKIEETIVRLDEKKKEALNATFSKVNVDFGAILGELLPGNTANLAPCDGKTIEDGVEVKVCLGGVWKESLTELSGGQRSLIALALILSLLQFKPAPMYVLDEVDAALDLSHTQNIGHLLKTRFKGSQFIVVSLKEGMFNNANVLFKARFRDGSSIVERHAQK